MFYALGEKKYSTYKSFIVDTPDFMTDSKNSTW